MSNKEKIQVAKDLIIEAMELVGQVVEDKNMTAHYQAYGKYGFDQLLGNGNKYDSSIDKLLNY